MNNNEILKKLIEQYGLEKAIMFCEMNVDVYNMMYMDAIEVPLENEELMYEYDYQRYWWKEALNELTQPVEL